MKKIYSILSSTRTTAFLLIVFGITIGLATFIENDFGTDAARSLVYNATWFELLLTAGVINIIALSIKSKMYQRSKLTILVVSPGFRRHYYRCRDHQVFWYRRRHVYQGRGDVEYLS